LADLVRKESGGGGANMAKKALNFGPRYTTRQLDGRHGEFGFRAASRVNTFLAALKTKKTTIKFNNC